MPEAERSAAQGQEQAVIQAARLAVATYPIPYPGAGGSDIDFYMAKLRDALEALDARCEALEASRHYTRRMLQALDIYWFCAEGLPKGRYPRGRYTAEDWWNRYERYRALVEESIVV